MAGDGDGEGEGEGKEGEQLLSQPVNIGTTLRPYPIGIFFVLKNMKSRKG